MDELQTFESEISLLKNEKLSLEKRLYLVEKKLQAEVESKDTNNKIISDLRHKLMDLNQDFAEQSYELLQIESCKSESKSKNSKRGSSNKSRRSSVLSGTVVGIIFNFASYIYYFSHIVPGLNF